MVWGCIAASARLSVTDRTISLPEMLKENVWPTVHALNLKQSWAEKKDSDPKHQQVHVWLV